MVGREPKPISDTLSFVLPSCLFLRNLDKISKEIEHDQGISQIDWADYNRAW